MQGQTSRHWLGHFDWREDVKAIFHQDKAINFTNLHFSRHSAIDKASVHRYFKCANKDSWLYPRNFQLCGKASLTLPQGLWKGREGSFLREPFSSVPILWKKKGGIRLNYFMRTMFSRCKSGRKFFSAWPLGRAQSFNAALQPCLYLGGNRKHRRLLVWAFSSLSMDQFLVGISSPNSSSQCTRVAHRLSILRLGKPPI